MSTIDLLTTEEARAAVSKAPTDAAGGSLLAQYVTAISQMLVDRCGPIVQGTVVETLDGANPLYLTNYPVGTVTQVVDSSGTLTASQWRVHETAGRLEKLESGAVSRWTTGVDEVTVTYQYGRCTSTATVPENFKAAASITLKNWWRATEPSLISQGEYEVPRQSFPTFPIPDAAKGMLGREWHGGSGFGD